MEIPEGVVVTAALSSENETVCQDTDKNQANRAENLNCDSSNMERIEDAEKADDTGKIGPEDHAASFNRHDQMNIRKVQKTQMPDRRGNAMRRGRGGRGMHVYQGSFPHVYHSRIDGSVVVNPQVHPLPPTDPYGHKSFINLNHQAKPHWTPHDRIYMNRPHNMPIHRIPPPPPTPYGPTSCPAPPPSYMPHQNYHQMHSIMPPIMSDGSFNMKPGYAMAYMPVNLCPPPAPHTISRKPPIGIMNNFDNKLYGEHYQLREWKSDANCYFSDTNADNRRMQSGWKNQKWPDNSPAPPVCGSKDNNGACIDYQSTTESKTSTENNLRQSSSCESAMNTSYLPQLILQLSSSERNFSNVANQPAHTLWHYIDMSNTTQGPYDTLRMLQWFNAGYFRQDTMVRRGDECVFSKLENGNRLLEVGYQLASQIYGEKDQVRV